MSQEPTLPFVGDLVETEGNSVSFVLLLWNNCRKQFTVIMKCCSNLPPFSCSWCCKSSWQIHLPAGLQKHSATVFPPWLVPLFCKLCGRQRRRSSSSKWMVRKEVQKNVKKQIYGLIHDVLQVCDVIYVIFSPATSGHTGSPTCSCLMVITIISEAVCCWMLILQSWCAVIDLTHLSECVLLIVLDICECAETSQDIQQTIRHVCQLLHQWDVTDPIWN